MFNIDLYEIMKLNLQMYILEIHWNNEAKFQIGTETLKKFNFHQFQNKKTCASNFSERSIAQFRTLKSVSRILRQISETAFLLNFCGSQHSQGGCPDTCLTTHHPPGKALSGPGPGTGWRVSRATFWGPQFEMRNSFSAVSYTLLSCSGFPPNSYILSLHDLWN